LKRGKSEPKGVSSVKGMIHERGKEVKSTFPSAELKSRNEKDETTGVRSATYAA